MSDPLAVVESAVVGAKPVSTLKIVVISALVCLALMAVKARVPIPVIDPAPGPQTQTSGAQ